MLTLPEKYSFLQCKICSCEMNSQALICKSPGKRAVKGFANAQNSSNTLQWALKKNLLGFLKRGDCTALNWCRSSKLN